jgi:hypothetical protein
MGQMVSGIFSGSTGAQRDPALKGVRIAVNSQEILIQKICNPPVTGVGSGRSARNAIKKFIRGIAKTAFLCYKIRKVTEVFRNPQSY